MEFNMLKGRLGSLNNLILEQLTAVSSTAHIMYTAVVDAMQESQKERTLKAKEALALVNVYAKEATAYDHFVVLNVSDVLSAYGKDLYNEDVVRTVKAATEDISLLRGFVIRYITGEDSDPDNIGKIYYNAFTSCIIGSGKFIFELHPEFEAYLLHTKTSAKSEVSTDSNLAIKFTSDGL